MDALWLALIYAAQTQVLLRLQSRAQQTLLQRRSPVSFFLFSSHFFFGGKAQTLLQRRSPVSFSFLLRIHEQECLAFSSFLVPSERFSDWQLYRHLPADAEGKAFAKDFVAAPAPASSQTRPAMPDIEDAEKVSLESQ